MSHSTTWEIELPPNIESLGLEHLNKVCSCRRRVFTTDEDKYLAKLVTSKECTNWFEVAQKIPGRTPRQCRDRWTNYLCPTNSFEPWTPEEDQKVIEHVNELGTRWSLISKLVPGRSDNCIKNRWYSGLKAQCAVDQHGKYYLRSSSRGSSKKSSIQSAPSNLKTEENITKNKQTKPKNTILFENPAPKTTSDASNSNLTIQNNQPQTVTQQPSYLAQSSQIQIQPPLMQMAQPQQQIQAIQNSFYQYQPQPPPQQIPIQQNPIQIQPISFFISEFDQNDLKSSFETQSISQNDQTEEDDFWDKQLYKQIIGISQDPFNSTPDLFGEWF